MSPRAVGAGPDKPKLLIEQPASMQKQKDIIITGIQALSRCMQDWRWYAEPGPHSHMANQEEAGRLRSDLSAQQQEFRPIEGWRYDCKRGHAF
jgi:hypothetical protein